MKSESDTHQSIEVDGSTGDVLAADWLFVARLPIWTLAEALDLSLAEIPASLPGAIVSANNPPTPPGSPRLKREQPRFSTLRKQREITIQRAFEAGELTDPTTPQAFLEWADRLGMWVPDPLSSRVAVQVRRANLEACNRKLNARIVDLEQQLERDKPNAPDAKNQHCWPWGDYETEWLRLLAQAAREFWSTYEPGATPSKSKDVAAWLLKQTVNGKPVSPTNAKVIAQILRADGLPNRTA